MTVNEDSKPIRIRNLSSTGALIDQVDFTEQMIGVRIMVEVFPNEMHKAEIRWIGDQEAGIQFTDPISLDDLDR